MGKTINLLTTDPFVITQITGNSREAGKSVAFSVFTARSSPNNPTVFLPPSYSLAQHHPTVSPRHQELQKYHLP
jgi:hypothetical protein